MTYKKSNRRFS